MITRKELYENYKNGITSDKICDLNIANIVENELGGWLNDNDFDLTCKNVRYLYHYYDGATIDAIVNALYEYGLEHPINIDLTRDSDDRDKIIDMMYEYYYI